MRGFDQSMAWVMAVFFTLVIASCIYGASRYLAKQNYVEIYGNEDEEMRRAKAESSVDTKTKAEKAAEQSAEHGETNGHGESTDKPQGEHTAATGNEPEKASHPAPDHGETKVESHGAPPAEHGKH